jgi:hypothetical protein
MKQFIGALLLLGITIRPASSNNDLPQSAEPAPGNLLISQNSMESLLGASQLSLEGGSLTLEPGVKVTRTDEGYVFATHNGKNISFAAGSTRLSLASPARAQWTPSGWVLAGRPVDSLSLQAQQASQDDTDSNLKSMQDAAKKLKEKSEPANKPQTSKHRLRVRWLFGEDPMPTAELFNTAAIQQLTHLSNIGF